MPVQPSQRGARSLIDGRGVHQSAGHTGGYRPVAIDQGGAVLPAQQCLIRHHQIHRDRRSDLSRPAGHAFHHSVGHDLPAGPIVERGVGRAFQRRIYPHALRDRQQHGHVGHGVGCGTDGDRALGFGADGAVDDSLRVQLVGDGFGVGFDSLVALAFELGLVGAHPDVQGAAITDIETGRLAHDQGGPPFREHPGFQGGQGVGHLVDEGSRKADVAAAAIGGIVTGQGDLAR